MRKIALLPQPTDALKRLMLYKASDGVYLFGYDTLTDSNSQWDLWFETVDEAELAALQNHHVAITYWEIIPDPLEGHQHDWIAPVLLNPFN
ncbi:hypothetical protein [Hymenobacter aerophilus]|uniref:hypothetical protein n=1 Tax=Hymenobacter aerophilus TaxID=119644 RepID=UPI0012FC266F|nr:hypothetical protein [Hymenobacter aerophilus]